jgi:predicted neuraminidase
MKWKAAISQSVACLAAGCAVLVLGLGAVSQQPLPVTHSVVYQHASSDPYARDNFYGFNHAPSVVLLPDGRLLATWFSGPFEASVDQLILGAYSADAGQTWSKAVVMQDFPHTSDFDPAFIADGVTTLFFFSAGRENRYPWIHDEKNNVGPASFKTYLRTSEDSGHTWSPPRVVGERVYCRSNGIRLASGELLLPIYEIPSRAGVLKSIDRGKAWKRYGSITTRAGAGEPSIAETKAGTILMVLRTSDGFLWTTTSSDKGENWSTPVRTGIHAATTSHSLFRLSDGRLLLTLNESPANVRSPLVMRISADDGATWSNPVTITQCTVPKPDDPVWAREVSYPSVAELKDGTVVVVWAKLVLSDSEQYGDIEASRVRVR